MRGVKYRFGTAVKLRTDRRRLGSSTLSQDHVQAPMNRNAALGDAVPSTCVRARRAAAIDEVMSALAIIVVLVASGLAVGIVSLSFLTAAAPPPATAAHDGQ